MKLELTRGDITAQPDIDAIVNAANSDLAPGAGVCGAIRRVGGPAIFEEAARLGGCPTGDARATSAGDLPNRFVIHAVGPRLRRPAGGRRAARVLPPARRRGGRGAQLPLDRVSGHLDRHLRLSDRRGGADRGRGDARGRGRARLELVRFVLFSAEDLAAFEAAAASGP